MYAFQTNHTSRKKDKRIIRFLLLVIFLLVIALVGVSYSFTQQKKTSAVLSDSLTARATSEADSAQSAVYRLTQSSGTNTASLLSNVRSHVYALQSLNMLTQNIYGADHYLTDPSLLDACFATLDNCELRLQAGNVLTTQFTELRDEVNAIAALFGL